MYPLLANPPFFLPRFLCRLDAFLLSPLRSANNNTHLFSLSFFLFPCKGEVISFLRVLLPSSFRRSLFPRSYEKTLSFSLSLIIRKYRKFSLASLARVAVVPRAFFSRSCPFRRITLILIYLVERICICIHAYVCVYVCVCVHAEQRVEKQCPM